MPTYFVPPAYEKSLTPAGRARTIAAFYIAQGNPQTLGNAEMRRDVLTALMSKSAIAYWLNQRQWLEHVRTVGTIKMLRLTEDGLRTCANSAAGGSDTPTTSELITEKRRAMRYGGEGHMERIFPNLSE